MPSNLSNKPGGELVEANFSLPANTLPGLYTLQATFKFGEQNQSGVQLETKATSTLTVNGPPIPTPQPSWTLAAIPSPATFTASGQVIGYSYTLTNTGNVTISSIGVTGTKTGSISCAASTLAAGASTTCTSSYTAVAADVGANIAFATTATGTPASGTLANATASGNITYTAQPSLALATTASPTTFSRPGQAITFTYTVRNTGNMSITSLVMGDSKVSGIVCAATTLAAGANATCSGTYTTTAADLTSGTGITSTATARGTANSTTVTSAAVTITVGINVAAVRAVTQKAIQSFMSQRANFVTSVGPDVGRMHSRLTGSLFGTDTEGDADQSGPTIGLAPSGLGSPRSMASDLSTGPGNVGSSIGAVGNGGYSPIDSLIRPRTSALAPGFSSAQPFHFDRYYGQEDQTRRLSVSPFGFSGAAEDGIGRFAFSTSLTQMRASIEAAEAQKRAATNLGPFASASLSQDAPKDSSMGLGAASLGISPTASSAARASSRPPAFDIWVEGTSSYYSTERIDGKRQGHTAVMFAGADYVVMPGLLVGVMAQMDWMSETSSALTQNRDGRGWMVGPYVSARLTQNVYFDTRAAWGQSNNHVDPLGAYTDKFFTERALASAKLTGDWALGAFRFRPSAEVIYFTERQKEYTNAIGLTVPDQTASLGRTIFGPEFGYRMRMSDKSVLEPFVGLRGVWDFAKTQETTASGEPVGQDGLRGRVEAGATYRTPSGISIRGSGMYDGIGSNGYHSYQGQAFVVVPLQ